MSKYYYHPLGEYGKCFEAGIAKSSEWPHTYDNSFGVNRLDWGSGSNIPTRIPVYSMTNGKVKKILTDHSDDNKGFAFYVETDRKDSNGKTIWIHYTKLSGVSEKFASELGINEGANSEAKYNGLNVTYEKDISVRMGDQLGYTNDWYGNFANLHTDFLYEGQESNSSTTPEDFIDKSPTVHENNLDENFTIEDTDSGVKIVKCGGKEVGKNGMVRLQNGSPSIYPVYPFVSYMTCQQVPIERTTKKSGFPGIDGAGWYPSDDTSVTGIEGYFSNGRFTFPVFRQWAGPWAGMPFMSGDTYANSGCSQCATAIVVSGIMGEMILPTDVTAVFTELYGVQPGSFSTSSLYTWNAGAVAKYYGGQSLGSSKGSGLTMTQAIDYLKEGYPIMLNVGSGDTWGNGYVTVGDGHLITLLGYDESNDKVFLGDPAHPSGWFPRTQFMVRDGSYQEVVAP